MLPENQGFCEAVQGSSRLFSAPEPNSDDAVVLQEMKDTFANLASLAPTSIKPEVQAMANVIQSLGSANDITKLNDRNFTANQERFARFVKDECGFDVSA